MTEEVISHHSNGAVFVSLIRRAEPHHEWEWFVQVSEGEDSFEEESLDEWAARSHYRAVCHELGIRVGYDAPTFAIDFTRPPTQQLTAAEVYHRYTAELGRLQPGSDEATALRDRMMADEQFIGWSRVIHDLAEGGTGWIAASIRASCKRIEAKQRLESQRESERMVAEVEGYGDF